MDTTRYDLKLFAAPGAAVTGRDLVPVFHRWIQQSRLDDLLIDVADYDHVHHGPAAVLVGHQAHYVYDLAEGRPGLLYSRRREARPAADGATRLRAALRAALAACAALESEETLAGRLAFRGDELLLRVNDRLAAAGGGNGGGDGAEADLRHLLRPLLAELFAGAEVRVERRDGGADTRPTLAVHAAEAPDVATLLARLAPPAEPFPAAAGNGHGAGAGAAR